VRVVELRHLRYFVTIAEEQSFTRAAERLWVAQPGLSTQIRRLEDELGIKLFERHTRGVDLTDAGEAFLERARAALAAAENCRAIVSDLESGLVGTIRLGIATCARWARASSLLECFAESRPDVELTVVAALGGTLLRDLRDGRLDAMLAPSVFASPELHRTRLGREAWVALVGTRHRLGHPGPLDAGELKDDEIIVTGHRDGAGYDRAVAEILHELGVGQRLRRGGPGPALFRPVADGDALALSTTAVAESGELIARPLRPARDLNFELLWRDEIPSPALAGFIHAATAHARAVQRPQLVAL
jgi:DNA-binding transcriptional LysR family regulator